MKTKVQLFGIGSAAVFVVAVLVASSFQLMAGVRKESALETMIGKCFDTGAGAVGRMIYVAGPDNISLAFPSGNIVVYPFDMLSKSSCPGSARENG